MLATAAATDGAFSLLLSHAPPGDGAPLHVHRDESESFFVLAGTYRIWCGDDTFEAGVQDFVYLPRGVPHAWRVVSEMAGRKLILAVPRRRRLPGSNWAVPSRWIAGRGNLGRTLIWGLTLGPGLMTRNSYAGMLLLPVLLLACSTPTQAGLRLGV